MADEQLQEPVQGAATVAHAAVGLEAEPLPAADEPWRGPVDNSGVAGLVALDFPDDAPPGEAEPPMVDDAGEDQTISRQPIGVEDARDSHMLGGLMLGSADPPHAGHEGAGEAGAAGAGGGGPSSGEADAAAADARGGRPPEPSGPSRQDAAAPGAEPDARAHSSVLAAAPAAVPAAAPTAVPVAVPVAAPAATSGAAPAPAPTRPLALGAGAAGSLAALRRSYGEAGAEGHRGLEEREVCEEREEHTGRGAGLAAGAGPEGESTGPAPAAVATTTAALSAGPSPWGGGGPVRETEDDEDLEVEWTAVAARTEEMRLKEAGEAGKIRAKTDDASTPISYQEVQQWLARVEVDDEVLEASREQFIDGAACGCIPQRRRLSEIPGLDRKLWKDRDLVMFLRVTHFDFNDLSHFRMLRTLYTKLTRNKACASIGGHWVDLGFQHTDPRSDLNRSGGLLNVLHLFVFMTQHFEILKAAFLLSQDEHQNFPLACISINITKQVMESLFAGRLSSLCNSGGAKGVFDTTCRMHAAGLFHFYSRWRSLKRTIQDTERTLKEVEALLQRRPAMLLKGLKEAVVEQRAKADPSRFEFTDLDFGAARAAAPQRAAVAPQPPAQSVPRRMRNYHDADA